MQSKQYGKSYYGFLKVILLIVSIISVIWVLILGLLYNSIYSSIIAWPFCFLLYIIICYSSTAKIKPCHALGLSLVTLIELLPRYVIYPILVLSMPSSYYGVAHISYNLSSVRQGVLFGSIELIVFSFFTCIYERTKTRGKNDSNVSDDLQLIGSNFVYLIYIIFSAFIYLIIGRRYNIVQFVSMATGYAEIAGNIYITLVKYIVSIALSLCTLMILNSQKKMYLKNHKKIHIIFALGTAMIYTGFIVGESRSTQIAIGILMLLILVHDYPKERKSITIWMGASIIVVVISITLFRTGSTHIFGNGLQELTDKLQVYYGGPTSITQSVTVLKSSRDIGISKLIFDFIRSSFPFNLFLKNNSYTTSQIYNLMLYGGKFTHGHIVFGASYGYIFLGFLGIPFTMCLNYYLISKANEIYYKTASYEIKYVSGYCLIRLVNAFLVNTPTILGSVTQYIGTFGLLILFSILLRRCHRR